MKLFNIENGIEKAYVQQEDLILLTSQNDELIPPSICKKVFDSIVIIDNEDMVTIDDTNEDLFIEFEEQFVVEYLKNLKWIANYKEIRDLSEERILFEITKIEKNIDNLKEKYDNLTDSKKNSSQYLLNACELLNHKIDSYNKILLNKKGELKIPFPLVPDSDGFHYNSNESSFDIRASIDPSKILIYRKDGLPLAKQDRPSKNFIKNGIEAAIKNRMQNNEFFKDYKIDKYYSDNNMYYVSELIIQEEKQIQKTGFVDKIKNIFTSQRKK